MKLGIRGHSSFSIHFFFTALVLAAAIVFRCDLLEWCILLGCIGMVLTAELFNSAIETLFRGLDEPTRERVWPCLDIAAGAVLLASITAAIIGSILFLNKLTGREQHPPPASDHGALYAPFPPAQTCRAAGQPFAF
jgi:diacylglycerol kinase